MSKIPVKRKSNRKERETALMGKESDKDSRLPSKVEAKSEQMDGKDAKILGVTVSGSPEQQVLKKIGQVCNEKAITKPFFIVTAYSEFFLEANQDKKFKAALESAHLILPDGVSVPVAADYLQGVTGNKLRDFGWGLAVGAKVLKGEYRSKTIVGVKLTREILKLAASNKWRVFLLGGFADVAEKLTYKLQRELPGTRIESDRGPQRLTDQGGQEYEISQELKHKIDNFAPDVLLVALGRFKQEKWIAQNMGKLSTKVVVGVGSSFDEILGEGAWRAKAPEWVERIGMKWLWRVFLDSKHLKRAWRAFPVFPWRVFMGR